MLLFFFVCFFFFSLSPKIQLIVESLDEELSERDPKLVEWFKMEQLPALTKCVTAVVEKSTSHYVERLVMKFFALA